MTKAIVKEISEPPLAVPVNKSMPTVRLGYEGLPPIKRFISKKSKKVLTNTKRFDILGSVNKLIHRKDDKMATDKTKMVKSKSMGISIAWLGFAVQQGFVGYILLTNFSNYFVIASACISLGIAGTVVATHFVKAHKS